MLVCVCIIHAFTHQHASCTADQPDYIHTHTHTHIHTCIHTHTHTCRHTSLIQTLWGTGRSNVIVPAPGSSHVSGGSFGCRPGSDDALSAAHRVAEASVRQFHPRNFDRSRARDHDEESRGPSSDLSGYNADCARACRSRCHGEGVFDVHCGADTRVDVRTLRAQGKPDRDREAEGDGDSIMVCGSGFGNDQANVGAGRSGRAAGAVMVEPHGRGAVAQGGYHFTVASDEFFEVSWFVVGDGAPRDATELAFGAAEMSHAVCRSSFLVHVVLHDRTAS
jgi:hypothetical protein